MMANMPSSLSLTSLVAAAIGVAGFSSPFFGSPSPLPLPATGGHVIASGSLPAPCLAIWSLVPTVSCNTHTMASTMCRLSSGVRETVELTNHEGNPNNNVIVVGGGLAGLSVSLGLVQLRYRVHVVERRDEDSMQKRKGGTYLMQPNAIKALEEVCQEAMDPLYDVGVTIPSSECKMYAWWMIRDSLLQQVGKRENITLWTGWTFSELEDGDGKSDLVEARFTRTRSAGGDDSEEEESLELEGVLLLGCDGVNSAVRVCLDLPPANPTGSTCWRGSITVTDENSPLAPFLTTPLLSRGAMVQGYINCGPCILGLKSFHSKYPGVMTWTVNVRESDVAASHPRDAVGPYLGDDRETAEIFNEVLELADPEELRHALPFVTIAPPEEDGGGWGGRGRVALLGDAAHAMRSAGGQGGAMGFEDCVVLTRLLGGAGGTEALSDRARAEEVVSEFENSRLPRVRKIWHDQMERAERAYAKGISSLQADEEFFAWVNKGV